MSANPTKASRYNIRDTDAADPESLRSVLNDYLLDLARRVEALEAVKGVLSLPPVSFDTGTLIGIDLPPFSPDSGGVRVSCPFTPSGVVLLRLECVSNPGAILTATSDVKWHYGAGPSAGEGLLHIDYVTGLAVNSSYRLTLGVTRA